jgi:hypothetical protein
MAQNQFNLHGDDLTMPVPLYVNPAGPSFGLSSTAPIGPCAGDPLMFGNPSNPVAGGVSSRMLAGVAQDNYTPPTGVVNPSGVSVDFDGVWLLSVSAVHSVSAPNPTAIAPGDGIYAEDNGTYDATTGCYYGFTLNADSTNGHHFGNALDAVAAGATATIRVRLKKTG